MLPISSLLFSSFFFIFPLTLYSWSSIPQEQGRSSGSKASGSQLELIEFDEIPPGKIPAQALHCAEVWPGIVLHCQGSLQQVRVLMVEGPDLPLLHGGAEKTGGLPR